MKKILTLFCLITVINCGLILYLLFRPSWEKVVPKAIDSIVFEKCDQDELISILGIKIWKIRLPQTFRGQFQWFTVELRMNGTSKELATFSADSREDILVWLTSDRLGDDWQTSNSIYVGIGGSHLTQVRKPVENIFFGHHLMFFAPKQLNSKKQLKLIKVWTLNQTEITEETENDLPELVISFRK